MGTNSAMAAFDQMEEKVLQQEARSESAARTAGRRARKFSRSLEGGSGRGRRNFAALKKSLEGGPRALPLLSADTPTPVLAKRSKVAEVNAELEELKSARIEQALNPGRHSLHPAPPQRMSYIAALDSKPRGCRPSSPIPAVQLGRAGGQRHRSVDFWLPGVAPAA